ncbi:MAG: hypothetical protein IT465_06165, partial [Moraxellaceae bacterium]|nr:hypothetical protein [Moraxellaceae bacterium]
MIKKIGLALLIGALSSTAVANKALDDLRAGSKSDDGWRLVKYDRRHEVKAYIKREEGNNIRSFRVEAYFDAPIEVI